MPEFVEKFNEWWSTAGIGALNRILPCIVILVVGAILIRIITTITKRALKKSKLEKAAHSLIKSVLRIVLWVLVLLIAASALGIDVTGVVALASVVTLALSLALQNSLTNVIGGFTLLYTHPFASGHYVEIAGQSGTVVEIGMAYTKLTTPDNKLISIPNASVVSAEIVNYTVTGTRRVDVNIGVDYAMPVEKVLAALREAAEVPQMLEEQGFIAEVINYGDSAIEYSVRIWTKTEDYWRAKFDIQYRVREIFEREKLEMTYPHLTVHLHQ